MEYVALRSFDNGREAVQVMKMLRQRQINCHIHMDDDPAIAVLPSNNPKSQSLMVHYSQLLLAWELIEQAEERFLRGVPCPVCHAHKLRLVTINRPHSCQLSAIFSMMLNGKSIEVKRFYSCDGCGFDFDHF